MIGVFMNDPEQYLKGTRYKKKTSDEGDYFEYAILEYPRKSYGQIVNNLIAEQGRLTIRTNWGLDFKVNEFIVDNYGVKWLISNIVVMAQEVNAQVLRTSIINPQTDLVISLVKVDNLEQLK